MRTGGNFLRWEWNHESGFGLVDVKREGQKIGPATYLTFRGDWPPRSFYTDEEYAQLQRDGWECLGEVKQGRD